MFTIKFLIAYIIPDTPADVKMALSKVRTISILIHRSIVDYRQIILFLRGAGESSGSFLQNKCTRKNSPSIALNCEEKMHSKKCSPQVSSTVLAFYRKCCAQIDLGKDACLQDNVMS